MKYERSDEFIADFGHLTPRERELFREAVRVLNAAYEVRADRGIPRWPSRLRIKPVKGATGIWEMTWSFTGPDGRATFEYRTIDGELAIHWRRIGGHDIFRNP